LPGRALVRSPACARKHSVGTEWPRPGKVQVSGRASRSIAGRPEHIFVKKPFSVWMFRVHFRLFANGRASTDDISIERRRLMTVLAVNRSKTCE
jgi:hypothetical protein